MAAAPTQASFEVVRGLTPGAGGCFVSGRNLTVDARKRRVAERRFQQYSNVVRQSRFFAAAREVQFRMAGF